MSRVTVKVCVEEEDKFCIVEEDKKPYVNLKIKHQVDRSVVQFRVVRNVKFGKLFNRYCDHKGVVHNLFRFLFDGKYVKDSDTPSKLGMEDGDEIDAMLGQNGGFNM